LTDQNVHGKIILNKFEERGFGIELDSLFYVDFTMISESGL
jgi:hypothetical protein